MKIAEKIYRLRTEHDMTQSQLAKIAGVSDKAVSAWEAGTRDPKIKSIQGICSHFGIDINRFIDEDTNDYREKAPTPVSESGPSDKELISLWSSLTPEEILRVKDFALGLKAARKEPPSRPE
ncbi:helix-turn-helix transcriptional regulator [Intestinimonas butyriciproducens]|nr:helix-turn-helix transcriptional regulator [Intestinimonas butyriciproducens]